MRIKLILMLLLFASLAFAQNDNQGEFNIDDYVREKSGGKDATTLFGEQYRDMYHDIWDTTDEAGGVVAGTITTLFGGLQASQCAASQEWLDFGNLNWLMPSVWVAIIIIFGITLVYMISQLFQLPNLATMAKYEYFASMSTVVRVLLIIGILASVDAGWYQLNISNARVLDDPIYGNLQGVDDPSRPFSGYHMIDAAMVFALRMVREMNTIFSNMLLYNMVIHTLYTSTLWFGFTWRAMYSFNLGPVLKPIIDILGVSMNLISIAVGEYVLHFILLCITKKWVFSMFIPLGMLLRAFPQTRAGGESIFALAFSLSLIYPFMFIVTYEAHKIMAPFAVSSFDPNTSIVTEFITKSNIFEIAFLGVAFLFLSAGAFMPVLIEAGIQVTLQLVKEAVYYIVIIGLVLPFLNIFMTLTVAKEFAKGFGGVDVNYMAFVRLI